MQADESDRTDAAAAAAGELSLSPASQTLAAFARKLSHDLNNFATVVRTYSELLLTELPPGQSRNDVQEIHRASDAMASYLLRVGRFARIGTMRAAPVTLSTAIADLQGAFPSVRRADSQQLVIGMHAVRHDVVELDAIWLREVLTELLHNACEAAPVDGTITLSVYDAVDDDDRVVIEVADHGPGFDPTVATSAAAPFVSTKEGVRGAGFGLTIAAAFAEAIGARLTRTRDSDTTRVALWLRAGATRAPTTAVTR
jgi:signal transduction histidine kinase